MSGGNKLELYGNFTMFGLPLVLWGSYEVQPSSSGKQEKRIFSLGIGGCEGDPLEPTLADGLECVGKLVSPRFLIPGKPWRNFLDEIDLRKVSFVIELDGKGERNLKLVYDTGKDGELKVDFGFLSFTIRRVEVSYGSAQGLGFSLAPGSPKPFWVAGDTLSWSGSRPELPAPKTSLFKLSYLGVGQRIALALKKNSRTVVDAIAEIKEQTKGKEHGDPSDPAWKPIFDYDPASALFFAADLSLLGEIRAAVVFWDGHIYGLQLSVTSPAKRLKYLEGFEGSILYSKGANGQKTFAGKLQLPSGVRTISFPPLSISIPCIEVMVSTDGDFLLDLGFPANNDFSRSFGLSLLPFVGSGGIKIQRSKTGIAGMPTPTSGTFASAYAFGLGLRAGLGGEYHWGPISGAITITVSAVFDGMLAMWEPEDKVGPSSYYYRLAATVAVEGRIYGKVDLYILAVSVDISARAQVQLVLESYRKAIITFEADVRASGSVKIAFVRISKSFSAHVSRVVEIGSDSVAPWSLPAHKGSTLSRSPRRSLKAPVVAREVHVPLTLCFAASLDLEESRSTEGTQDPRRLVAQPLIRLAGKAGAASPFETFLRALLKASPALSDSRTHARIDETNALVVGDTRFVFDLDEKPQKEESDAFTAFPMPPSFGLKVESANLDIGSFAETSAAGKLADTLLDYCCALVKTWDQYGLPDAQGPSPADKIRDVAQAGAFMLLHGHRKMSPQGATSVERSLYSILGQQFVVPENASQDAMAKLSAGNSGQTALISLFPSQNTFGELWAYAKKGPAAMLGELRKDVVSVGPLPPYRLVPKQFAFMNPLPFDTEDKRSLSLYPLSTDFTAAAAILGKSRMEWPREMEDPQVYPGKDAPPDPDPEWAALLTFTGRLSPRPEDRPAEDDHCIEILGGEAGASALLHAIIRNAAAEQLSLLCPEAKGKFSETTLFSLFRAELSTVTHPTRARAPKKTNATLAAELDMLYRIGLTNRGGTYLVLPGSMPAWKLTDGKSPEFALRFLVRHKRSPGTFRSANGLIVKRVEDDAVPPLSSPDYRLSSPAYRVRAGDSLASIAESLGLEPETLLAANCTSPGLFAKQTRILGVEVDPADTALDLAIKKRQSLSSLAPDLVRAKLAAEDGGARVMLGPSWVHELPTLPPGGFGFRLLRRKPTLEEEGSTRTTLKEIYQMIRFRVFGSGPGDNSTGREIGEDGKPVLPGSVIPALGPWDREASSSGEWLYEKTYGPGVGLSKAHGTGQTLSSEELSAIRLYQHNGRELSLQVEYLDAFGNAIPDEANRAAMTAKVRYTDPLVSLAHIPGVSLTYLIEEKDRPTHLRLCLELNGNSLRGFYEKADYDSRLRFLGVLEQAHQQHQADDVTLGLTVLVGREHWDVELENKEHVLTFISAIKDCASGKREAAEPTVLVFPLPAISLTECYGELRIVLRVQRQADLVDDLIPAESEVRRVDIPATPRIGQFISAEPSCRDLIDFAQRLEKAIPTVRLATASNPNVDGRPEVTYLVDARLLKVRVEKDAGIFACRPLSPNPGRIDTESRARQFLADVERALRPPIADRILTERHDFQPRLLEAKSKLADAIASQVGSVLLDEGRGTLTQVAAESLRQEALSDLCRAYGDRLVLCFVANADPGMDSSIALQGSVIDADDKQTVCEAKLKPIDPKQPMRVLAFPYLYGERAYGTVARRRFSFRIEYLEVEDTPGLSGEDSPHLSRWLKLVFPREVALTGEGGLAIPVISRFPTGGRIVQVDDSEGALEMEVAFTAQSLASDKIEYTAQAPVSEEAAKTETGLSEGLARYQGRGEELMTRLRAWHGDKESIDGAATDLLLLIEEVAAQWVKLWPKGDSKRGRSMRAPVRASALKPKAPVLSVALGPTVKEDRPRSLRRSRSVLGGGSDLHVVERSPHGARITGKLSAGAKGKAARSPRKGSGRPEQREPSVALVRNDMLVEGRRMAPEFVIRTVCPTPRARRRT
jgi:hypothetical protein